MKKILFVITLCLFWANCAFAQLLVEEGKIQLDIKPNQTIMNSIVIHNTSDKPVQVKVYWEDFIYRAPYTGEKDFFPAGSGQYSCASWVNFLPREFSIPAFGRQKVDYTIKVPKDVTGGYYGILFYENTTGQIAEKLGVKIVTRIGSLMFLETSDKNKTCRVSEWKTTEQGFSGKLTNEGNIFLLPQGIFYVLDNTGIVIDRGDLTRAYLPPQANFDFTIPYPKDLKAGDYQLILTFDLEDETSKTVELDFKKDLQGKIQLNAVRD